MDATNASGLLPVTGEEAPEMWDEHDQSVVRNFSAEEFMETPLGSRFYNEWKRGLVTDNLIGRRFGYAVLGRFYGQRDWENGVFEDEEGAGPAVVEPVECETPLDVEAGLMGTGVEGPPQAVEDADNRAEGRPCDPRDGAVSQEVAAGEDEQCGPGVGAPPLGAGAGASTALAAGGAEAGTSTALAAASTEGESVSVGTAVPKQTSLEHWLL